MSPLPAYSIGARDDTEVLSRRAAPKGGAQDAVREAPQGKTSTAEHMGEPIPMESGEEGRIQFGPQLNTTPEADVAPESGEQLPLKGGAPPPPVAPVHPGAPDDLTGALRSASVVDEHHVLMGAVIEKV